jgi:radical SAM superfamily enzyme YgiQ (UPF0313 family)
VYRRIFSNQESTMNDHKVSPAKKDRLRIMVCKPRLAKQTIKMDRFISCEPLELEYLYTVLQDHDVFLLDGITDHRDPVRMASRLQSQIVLFTTLITTVPNVLQTASRLKTLAEPPLIFVGGPHAEVVPEHFFVKDIDGVFFANQLEGIVRVIKRIQQNRPYHEVPGGAFPVNGTFVSNPSPPLDPSKLPRARHFLLEQYPNRYRIIFYKPCAAIKTSFGCTDHCTFCFCTQMHGGRYSARPIRDVVDEIDEISVKNILIMDDNFLTGRKRLLEFCDLIKNRQLNKEFIAIGNARFIAQNPDVISRLREAGVTALIVGFEFVTDEQLNSFHKRSQISENNQTIKICQDLGIDLFALFIINPDWRHSDFKQLAGYLREHDIPFVLFSTLTIFPGTQLARLYPESLRNESRWWRYDLLRLHQKPKHMSGLMYYLWMFYLYMIPGLRFTSLQKYRQRYGWLGIVRHSVFSFFTGLEFLVKLLIWP